MTTHLVQHIDDAALARLPESAVYQGRRIATRHVESIVPVGARESVSVQSDGRRWYPWRGVAIVEVSPSGDAVWRRGAD